MVCRIYPERGVTGSFLRNLPGWNPKYQTLFHLYSRQVFGHHERLYQIRNCRLDYTLSYTNGNLTAFEVRYDTIVSVARLEYYPEDVKFWTYLHNYYFVGNAVYYPWLGRHSKSLPKSIRFDKGIGFNTSYTYELDEKGYITKRTRILDDFNASTEALFEHECK